MPFCPECRVEYRQGFERCSECDVPLVEVLPPEEGQPAVPGPEWVTAAEFVTTGEALMAKGLLAEQGLESEVVDRHVVLHPFPTSDIGDARLVVPPESLERARALLAAADAGADRIDEGLEPAEPGESEESR